MRTSHRFCRQCMSTRCLKSEDSRLQESHVSAIELSICLLNKYSYRPIQSTQGLHLLGVKPKAINSIGHGVWTRYLSEDFRRAQLFQTMGQVPVLLRLTSVHTWGRLLASRSHLPSYITIPSGPMAPDVGPMYVAPPWHLSVFVPNAENTRFLPLLLDQGRTSPRCRQHSARARRDGSFGKISRQKGSVLSAHEVAQCLKVALFDVFFTFW
jgi:hypothetical protein